MIKGIDVSHWQNVDYKLDESGLGFVIIKASEALFRDPAFEQHVAAVTASHCLQTYYHFFRTATDAEAQAKLFWATVQPHVDSYTLPLVIDLEDPKASGDVNAQAKVFLDTLSSLSGTTPMVYTYKPFAIQWKLTLSANYPMLYAAAYASNPNTPYCGWDKPTFWQFSQTSTTVGENAAVDGDLFMGGPADLLALTGSSTFKGGLSPDDWQQKYNVKLY